MLIWLIAKGEKKMYKMLMDYMQSLSQEERMKLIISIYEGGGSRFFTSYQFT